MFSIFFKKLDLLAFLLHPPTLTSRRLQVTYYLFDCLCVCVCVCVRMRICVCLCVFLNNVVSSISSRLTVFSLPSNLQVDY